MGDEHPHFIEIVKFLIIVTIAAVVSIALREKIIIFIVSILPGVDIIIFTILVVIVITLFLLIRETCFIKLKKCVSKCGYMITVLFTAILFLVLIVLYLSQPPQIIVYPTQFEMKIPAGETAIKSMSVEYMGFSNAPIKLQDFDEFIASGWKFDCYDFNETIKSNETKTINCTIEVNLTTKPGEYREVINFTQDGKTIKDIPIFLTILPKAQYRVDIDPIPKVNASEYFKLKVTITNTGEAPVYGVNISLNSSLNNEVFIFNYSENNKPKNTLMNNSSFITYWWIGTNNETETSWKSIQFNITSENAGDQTEVTMINIEKQ